MGLGISVLRHSPDVGQWFCLTAVNSAPIHPHALSALLSNGPPVRLVLHTLTLPATSPSPRHHVAASSLPGLPAATRAPSCPFATQHIEGSSQNANLNTSTTSQPKPSMAPHYFRDKDFSKPTLCSLVSRTIQGLVPSPASFYTACPFPAVLWSSFNVQPTM